MKVEGLVKEHIRRTHRHGQWGGVDYENERQVGQRGQRDNNWNNCKSINNKS